MGCCYLTSCLSFLGLMIFSDILNLIYEDKKKRFRLSDVVTLNNSFIATVFKYDSNTKEPVFHSDNSKLKLKELTDIEI